MNPFRKYNNKSLPLLFLYDSDMIRITHFMAGRRY